MSNSNYNLRWDSFQNNLCDGFAYLQQKNEFVDMTLAADGYFVQVHQSIVALASPFLKTLLKSLTCPHPVIYLDVSHEVLCQLLEYIYSGELILPKEKCEEFMKYGKKLKIYGLDSVPNYYDEPLVIQKETATSQINQDIAIDVPQNSRNDIEITQNVVLKEATSNIHDAIIIQPTLESQTHNTDPIFIPGIQNNTNIEIIPNIQNDTNIEIMPTSQSVATLPKKDLQVSNKLMQLLESVENFDCTDNILEGNTEMIQDPIIPLSNINLSTNGYESAIPVNVQSELFAPTIASVEIHQDMPIISDINIDTQVDDNQIKNPYKNLDFFKSPNDIDTRLNTVESPLKGDHNMSIDENNETMNSIDTILEYKLLGDFSIGGKQRTTTENGIKDDPWDMIPVKNVVDLNDSEDSNMDDKDDKVIDVEAALDKMSRKKDNIDVSSLPILDNETLFDESFRKDSDFELSDEEMREEDQQIAPIEHSSPVPEVKVAVFGKVMTNIAIERKRTRENLIIQYMLSNRGSLQLILNRFVYMVHYKSGITRRRWRCVDYRQKHCMAYVDTNGELLVKRSNAHNHHFHDQRIGRQIAKGGVFSSMEDAVHFSQNKSKRASMRNKQQIEEDNA